MKIMPKRILEGVVVSKKTDKTAIVLVERKVMHPLYKKFITRSKRYAIHDPENQCQEGLNVKFIECRPISKTKKWALLEFVG